MRNSNLNVLLSGSGLEEGTAAKVISTDETWHFPFGFSEDMS